MNKFQLAISASGKEILSDRAILTSTMAEQAQQDIVTNLKKKMARLDLAILQTCDISRTSSTSLEGTKSGFDPEKWANELHKLKVERINLEVELGVAEETYKEFFTEVSKEDGSK